MLRRAFQILFGSIAGALMGLCVFVLGYIMASWPATALNRHAVALLASRALASLSFAEFACITLGACAGLLLARCSWRSYGVASYVAVVSVVAGYVLHEATVALPRVPAQGLPFSVLLFVAETASLALAAVHAFYALDIASRKRWSRRSDDQPFSSYYVPRVAFHVAAFNEPPELVEDTLRSILAVDYPRERLTIMLLDDSTDEAAVARLAGFCAQHGVQHLHRTDRRGFKAGALNDALKATPPEVELIAVVDADYQVDPAYLRETVGYFVDPKLGFLQTPQDYRNADESFITRRYHVADAFFYRAVMPSRNEEGAIIFCGTMGILRRAALEEAGAWGEAYLCEDSELSIRVIGISYHSLYVNRTYGRGLIPASYESFRKQHHRWAYGGGQILRGHAKRMTRSKMTFRQKADFLVGSLHWFDGAVMLLMAAMLLILGVADLLGMHLMTQHADEVLLLALVPFFLLFDGVVRLHVALRRSVDRTARATLGVLGLWMSVKLSNAWGATKGVLRIPMAFTRTEKRRGARAGSWPVFETLASGALLAVACGLAWDEWLEFAQTGKLAAARALLAAWIAFYGGAFGAAPWYAFRSRLSAWTDAKAREDAHAAET